jgi:hypothetical protein
LAASGGHRAPRRAGRRGRHSRLAGREVLPRALAAVHHVVVHGLPGGIGVARGDGLDDGAVLARVHRHRLVREVLAPEQRQLVDQLAVGGGQLGVAGQLQQPVVELQVEAVVVLRIAGLHRLVHRLDQLAQFAHLGRRGGLRELAAHVQVHHGAHLEDLQRLLDRHVAHEHAAVLLGAHQAGFFEQTEGLAHRAARHAELVGQRGLGQLRAGQQLAFQNHAFDFVLHQFGQGIALQLCNRRVGLGTGGHAGKGWVSE